MKIEVLYVPGCPNYVVSLRRIHEALDAEGLKVDLQQIEVHNQEMAERLGFPGSPTIRINGQDVVAPTRSPETPGMMCRLYAWEEGGNVPSLIAIRRAIRTAAIKES